MSQAHYVQCSTSPMHGAAVAMLRHPAGLDNWPVCKHCLDAVLDRCDDHPEHESLLLLWAWDSGTRWCSRCDWPAVLCADWTPAEHRSTWEGVRRRIVESAGCDPWRPAMPLDRIT